MSENRILRDTIAIIKTPLLSRICVIIPLHDIVQCILTFKFPCKPKQISRTCTCTCSYAVLCIKFCSTSFLAELLQSAGSLLDRLLDSSDQLLLEWATSELVEAVCEAAEQVR